MKKAKGRLYTFISRNVKLIPYLRELSLIILGIVITFGTTSVIERSSQKKEFLNTLTMLHAELAANLGHLERLQGEIKTEIGLYDRVRNINFNCDRLEECQLDSLLNEIPVLRSFILQNTTFEVFKSSRYIHATGNEELLIDVIRTYQNLGYLSGKIDVFYKNKQRVFIEQTENLNIEEWQKFISDSKKEYFNQLLSDVRVRNYFWSAYAHFDDEDIILTEQDVRITMNKIEKITLHR